MIEINEIDYGIACRIGNDIYINKNLLKYPELYSKIIEHEYSHSSGFTFNDLKMDLSNNHLKGLRKQYFSFIFAHPKAFIEFLPGWWYNNLFIINPSVLLVYGAILTLFGGIGLLL